MTKFGILLFVAVVSNYFGNRKAENYVELLVDEVFIHSRRGLIDNFSHNRLDLSEE